MSANARLTVNVALKRPAYQVSIYTDGGGSYPASNANDGSHYTSLMDHSCMHTEDDQPNPWWAVDLGVALYVFGVRFTNRDSSGKFVKLLRLSAN